MKGGRILIVDDEPMVRETISRVLLEEGYVVDCAIDGEVALQRCRTHPPDVILLDLMMPGMNGRQFLSSLRGEMASNVPVVVMTAVHGLGQRALSLGADDMVEKPFDVDELLNKVALAMFRSRRAGGAPPSEPSFAAMIFDGDGDGSDPDTDSAPTPRASGEKGVVLLVDHDRESLQRLDAMLSSRGYTVVSMTRVTPQLPRLARVLQPRAVLLDLQSRGLEVVKALRAEPSLDAVPILVFSRQRVGAQETAPGPAASVDGAGDEELLRFVEQPRGHA